MICRRRFVNEQLARCWANGIDYVNDSSIEVQAIQPSGVVPGAWVVVFTDTDRDEPDEEETDQL